MMLYRLGRFLQLLGLIIVPVALAGNLVELAGGAFKLDLKEMLLLSALGMVIFMIGLALQRRAGVG
jgi:hypothetical protein